jgi:hypothetical protein
MEVAESSQECEQGADLLMECSAVLKEEPSKFGAEQTKYVWLVHEKMQVQLALAADQLSDSLLKVKIRGAQLGPFLLP